MKTQTKTQTFSVVVVNSPAILLMGHSHQTNTLRVITWPEEKNDCCGGMDYFQVPRSLYDQITERAEDDPQRVERLYLREVFSLHRSGTIPKFGFKYLSNPVCEKFIVDSLLACGFAYLQVPSEQCRYLRY